MPVYTYVYIHILTEPYLLLIFIAKHLITQAQKSIHRYCLHREIIFYFPLLNLHNSPTPCSRVFWGQQKRILPGTDGASLPPLVCGWFRSPMSQHGLRVVLEYVWLSLGWLIQGDEYVNNNNYENDDI